jgi:probable F420-dependent oxidoreductase
VLLDAAAPSLPLRRVAAVARQVQDLGFSGLWFLEGGREAFLGSAVAATATEGLDVGTAVALAFPRSPMVTAQMAWELAEASGGRFVLGLGPQIKAHNRYRFSVESEPPAPRLREYVLALRAIFRAFQGTEPLAFHGEYYTHTLLPPTLNPGPIEHPDVPVWMGAVGPRMAQVAGEVADGLHVHPFHSRTYLADVLLPALRAGAEQAGRDPSTLRVAAPCFVATGESDEEIAVARDAARVGIAWYGTTVAYRPVFEAHGWGDTQTRLAALLKAGDHAGMAAAITDEMLDEYVVTARWDALAAALVARYDGLVDRVFNHFAVAQWEARPELAGHWGAVAAEVRRESGASSM